MQNSDLKVIISMICYICISAHQSQHPSETNVFCCCCLSFYNNSNAVDNDAPVKAPRAEKKKYDPEHIKIKFRTAGSDPELKVAY